MYIMNGGFSVRAFGHCPTGRPFELFACGPVSSSLGGTGVNCLAISFVGGGGGVTGGTPCIDR